MKVKGVNRRFEKCAEEVLRTIYFIPFPTSPIEASYPFEFRPAGNGEVIRGRVAGTVEAAEAINRHLHVSARIQLRTTHVGTGKPRYVLIAPPQWLGEA